MLSYEKNQETNEAPQRKRPRLDRIPVNTVANASHIITGSTQEIPSDSSATNSSATPLDPVTLNNTPTEREFSKKVLQDPMFNKLFFPDKKEAYEFNIVLFKDLSEIAATLRNTVKVGRYTRLNNRKVVLKYSSLNIRETSRIFKYNTAQKDHSIKHLMGEIKNFRNLTNERNGHIVDFYGFGEDRGVIVLCMEYMDMSLANLYTLYFYWESLKILRDDIPKKLYFQEDIIGYCTIKIVDALIFCESKKLSHRDIKPANILVNKKGHIKLCDFGESKTWSSSGLNAAAGTISYMPPEKFTNEQSNKFTHEQSSAQRTDIWSVGMTLAEIAYGACPLFPKEDSKENLNLNLNLNQLAVIPFIRDLRSSDNVKELINRCLDETYYSDSIRSFIEKCLSTFEHRPETFEDLRSLPFYKNSGSVARETVEIFIKKYSKLEKIKRRSKDTSLIEFEDVREKLCDRKDCHWIVKEISYLSIPQQDQIFGQLLKLIYGNLYESDDEESNIGENVEITSIHEYYVKKVVSTLSALPSFLTLKNFKKLETRHIRLLESHGGLFPLFVGDIDQTIVQARSMAESYRFKFIELELSEVIPSSKIAEITSTHVEAQAMQLIDSSTKAVEMQTLELTEVISTTHIPQPSKLIEALSHASTFNVNKNDLSFKCYSFGENQKSSKISLYHKTNPVECIIMKNIDANSENTNFIETLLDLNLCKNFFDEFINFQIDLSGIYFICTAKDDAKLSQTIKSKLYYPICA